LALEKSNKSRLEMKQAQQNIDKMHVASPMDGVIAIEKNVDSTGGMFWGGMSLPDYREGDQVRPGNAIAKVIDPSDMEMLAKADERARGNIRAGQAAEIQFDALPGQVFHGTVKTVAGMAMKNFWEDAASGSFEVTIQLPNTDTRLRAGLTAEVIIAGDENKKITYIPRPAEFLASPGALPFDNGWNEFRGSRRGLDAFDWRRSPSESHGRDRADGRSQPDCRGQGDQRLASESEGPKNFTWPDLPGLPNHFGQSRRPRCIDGAQTFRPDQDYS